MPANPVDCLQESQRLREKENKFAKKDLTEFEILMLESHSYSDDMTDYEYYRTDNQDYIHSLGRKLLGGISWEKSKELFIKLDDNQFVTELQKLSCPKNCYFDPLQCMNDEHDGRLVSLLKKRFHEQCPNFLDFFSKTEVLDPELKAYPPVYDEEGFADVDMTSLDIKNILVCRPLAEWNLRKLLNIVEAILEGSEVQLQNQRKSMFEVFMQKNSEFNPPRLAAMGFGPYCGQTIKYCDYFGESKSLKPEKQWNPVFFWQFTHGENSKCLGLDQHPNKFSVPFYAPDGRICYPCNTGYCHEKCPCQICSSVELLKEEPYTKHTKEHLEEYNIGCVLVNVQCTEHYVDHPDNFDVKDDMEIKIFNFLDMDLNEKEKTKFQWKRVNCPPRSKGNLQETLKLAGLKKNCKKCRNDINDHNRNHHVLHSQCKICDIRSKTISDESFWEKTCPECKIHFPRIVIRDMKRHIKGHDLDNLCELCGKGFRRPKYLMQHKTDIHSNDSKNFQCTICQKTYKQQRNLKLHWRLRHSNLVEKFSCPQCSTEFLYRFSLNKHLKSVHGVNSIRNPILMARKFECNQCKAIFQSESEMKIHKEYQHNDEVSRTEIHQCRICKTSCKTKYKLKRHIDEKHNNPMPFKCEVCLRTYARKEHLKRHRISSHESTKYICEVCNEEFTRKDALTRHRKIHSDDRFQCPCCNAMFYRYDKYVRHRKYVHKKFD
jgi:hypothetical protein